MRKPKETRIKSLFSARKSITGHWVAIMNYEKHNRALKLSSYRTRCIRAGEIHEFLLCNQKVKTDDPIDAVAYLGFGEMSAGGVIEVGDLFYCKKELIGKIIGFDETHFPNHYNIVLQGDIFSSGADRGLSLSDSFVIFK